ncbi:MAG TPA: amidase [Thermomicrobiales bacterium]|nr:amidase [Thermomicrobiales bacterium]
MSDTDILTLPLHAVAELVEGREISSRELTALSLAEIERTNPTSNAFHLVLAERAEDAAMRADGELAAGRRRGPLHGVPIAVKDLMDIAGIATAAGSKVLAGRIAAEDSEAVRRLEAEGAVIVGKTSMPEFAFSPASNNPHYGPVPNPWNAVHDSGGSSSGSGSAVASCVVYGATGSDTGGSIRMPSTLCGIVGLKPTFGRVSAAGAVSLSWSLDHIGPMTRAVRDAAIMLDALAGHDARDPRTRLVPVDDYAGSVERGVDGVKVAVVSDDGGGEPGTPAVMEGVRLGVEALQRAGASIARVAIPEFIDLSMLYSSLLVIEAATYYEPFLRERPDGLGEAVRDRLLAAYAYSPTFFVAGSQARAKLRRAIEERLAGFDLVVVPGMPHEAPPLGIVQNNTRYTGPFNALGWPAIVVPTVLGDNGLPVAIQIAAHPWREDLVVRAGRVVERDGPWQGKLPGRS